MILLTFARLKLKWIFNKNYFYQRLRCFRVLIFEICSRIQQLFSKALKQCYAVLGRYAVFATAMKLESVTLFSCRVDQAGGSTNFVMGNSLISFIRYYLEKATFDFYFTLPC